MKISDSNVVLGYDENSRWHTWSGGTVTPLPPRSLPAGPAAPLRGLKLPQVDGVTVVPVKKVANVPRLEDRKEFSAKLATTQVIGNGPGGTYLWELLPPGAAEADRTYSSPLPIDSFVADETTNFPWNVSSVADINSGGTMVGTAVYTRTGPNDPLSAGPHGVMILPMAIVRESVPGSGDYEPLVDNGLDNNSTLPVYSSPSGPVHTETDKTDHFSAGIYGGVNGPIRATMIFTLTTRFDKTDTGTLSETSVGSGVFEDKSTHVRVELSQADAAVANGGYLALVTDPNLGIRGDTHPLHQVEPNSNKYEDEPACVLAILKAALSTNAINTIDFGLGSGEGVDLSVPLMETAVNSRIFKTAGGLTVSITGYTPAPSGTMDVAVSMAGITNAPVKLTLQETSATSLQYSNYVSTIRDVPVSTPASDGEGVFYIEMAGTQPTKVTIVSGNAHATVEAVPVKGRPNLLRTGKLVMIQTGDPFRSPGITTIENAGSEVDLQMYGQTIVK